MATSFERIWIILGVWMLVLLTIAAEVLSTASSANSGANPLPCPDACFCVPEPPKPGIVCAGKNLTSVPTVNTSVHFVDFTGNSLETLTNDTLLPIHVARDHLETLLLKACAIRTIHNGAFDQLLNLRIVDLSSNRITSFPAGIFTQLAHLSELNLSDNNIQAVDAHWFLRDAPLRALNISANPIESLAAKVFERLRSLEELTMCHCALRQIDEKAFEGLFNLRTLDLSHNQLSTLVPDAITWLGGLRNLNLDENPWRCDCNLQALTGMLLARGFDTLPATLTCTNVANLTTNWTDAEATHSDCKQQMDTHLHKTLLSGSTFLRGGKPIRTQHTSMSRLDGSSWSFSSQAALAAANSTYSSVVTVAAWCAVILIAAVASYVGVFLASKVCVCATTKAAAAAAHAANNAARKKSSIVRRESSSDCERALVDETAQFRDHFYLVDEESSDISVSLDV